MMEGPGADSEEKRVLASALDTVMVDSLKALDLIGPVREADIMRLAGSAECESRSLSVRADKLHPVKATAAEPSVKERYQCQAETQSRGGR
jgi:hypothetical protein